MKRKTKIVGAALPLLILILTIGTALAETQNPQITLVKGKNLIQINQTMSASEFILLNKNIEYIWYFDDSLNQSVGYVNIFDGIGTDFTIEPGKFYEVGVSKEINLPI